MPKFIKIILIFFAVLLILPILAFFVLDLSSPDIDEVNDQDLIVDIEIPDESQNAYFDLIEIEGKLKSEDALNLFEDASKKSVYQNPAFENIQTLNFDSYNNIQQPAQMTNIARMAAEKSLYELESENYESALNTSLQIIKVAYLLMNSSDTLVQKMLAAAVYNIGLDTTNQIINEGEFSVEQLEEFQDEIDTLRYPEEGFNEGYKVNYMLAKNTVNYLESLNNKSFFEEILYWNNFYYKPNKTKQILADRTRALINNESVEDLQNILPENIIGVFITDNYLGKVIFVSLAVNDASEHKKNIEDGFNDLMDNVEAKLQKIKEEEPEVVKVKRK